MAFTHEHVTLDLTSSQPVADVTESVAAEIITFTNQINDEPIDLSPFERDSELAAVLRIRRLEFDASNQLAALPLWAVVHLPIDDLIQSASLRRDRMPEGLSGTLMECLARTSIRRGSLQVEIDDATAGGVTLPTLRPGSPPNARRWVIDSVAALDLMHAASDEDATAVRAGLLLFNDFLDASHEYSQSVQGEGRNAAGDYWHGIMHRREPDYSNAKYWYRRVGTHPIFVDLAGEADRLLTASNGVDIAWRSRLLPGGHWDPFAFVDLCESCPRSEEDALSRFAQQVQWTEMVVLLQASIRDAEV